MKTTAILAMGLFPLILLLPALSQFAMAHTGTLLALCTLLLFSGTIIGLSIRLLMMIRQWLAIRQHAVDQIRSSRRETSRGKQDETDAPRLQNSFLRGVESILLISAWAFFLNLVQPFITTLVWWQGYTLLEENICSLATIEGALSMIESWVYFGIIAFLILISWSQWNDWRYGRMNQSV